MRPGARAAARAALGALALLAVRARAEVPGAGGALAISADPPQLVLGRDAGAELRIAAPPEVAELAVTASVGRVDGIRRLPAGGFVARYHAPAERHPQVAILAAVGHAGTAALDGWLAIPLSGQGDARLRGAPGSAVSLRIGDQTFGPARVGADGSALLPVIVPPGVKEGHQGFAAVDLQIPEFSLVHGTLDRASVQADRAEVVRVFAYVVAPHGAGRPGEAPRAEASRGTVLFREREPGAFEGTWTLPPGPAGEERLALRLEGFPASKVTLRLTGLAGSAATVAVAFDRPALVARQGEAVIVTARALDGAGNPTAAPVVLATDAGTLTQEEAPPASPGVARGVLVLDPRFEGRTKVVVRGRVASGGATGAEPGGASGAAPSGASIVWGEASLPLQAGPPAAAALAPGVAYAPGDGRSEAVLSLRLTDAFGNPAAGVPRVTTAGGPAPRVMPAEPGHWEVRIRAGAVDDPARTRVEAEAGEARGAADVWLVPPRDRQRAILGGAGALAAGGRLGGMLLLGAEIPMPELVPQPPERALALRLELFAMQRDRRVEGETRPAGGFALLGGPVLKSLFPRGRWFGSATAGLVAGSGSAPGRSSRTGFAPALRFAIGLSAPVGRTAPWLELGVFAAGDTPAGSFGAVTLTMGVRHDWARRRTDGD